MNPERELYGKLKREEASLNLGFSFGFKVNEKTFFKLISGISYLNMKIKVHSENYFTWFGFGGDTFEVYAKVYCDPVNVSSFYPSFYFGSQINIFKNVFLDIMTGWMFGNTIKYFHFMIEPVNDTPGIGADFSPVPISLSLNKMEIFGSIKLKF